MPITVSLWKYAKRRIDCRMQGIGLRDARNVLEAVAILNENLDLATLARRTMAAVARVIPSDIVTYNEVDLVRRVNRVFSAPEDARLAPSAMESAAFLRHIDEHPLIVHNARVPDSSPRKISDFLSDRKFRSLGLYSEFFRVLDVRYQIALVVRHAGQQMIGIAANRALCDFTERERVCLAVLRSHIVQAYNNGLRVARFREEFVSKGEIEAPNGTRTCGLTLRELEVLHWVAAGKSNKDVARIVDATSATVKKHLEHIYEKLGVKNRTAASAQYADRST